MKRIKPWVKYILFVGILLFGYVFWGLVEEVAFQKRFFIPTLSSRMVRLSGFIHIRVIDIWNSNCIYVLDNSGSPIQVIVSKEILDEVRRTNWGELKKNGKTIFVDLNAISGGLGNYYVCTKVNSIKVVDGKVSMSK